MTRRSFDVVVVGNGAVALFTARALILARPETTVATIGPANRAASATAAAGAMLGCFGEVTATTTSSPEGRSRFALQLAAHRRWPGLLDELNDASPAGGIPGTADSYVIMNSRGGHEDSANYAAMLTALTVHHEPHALVDDVPGLNPVPDARPLSAVHLSGEGSIDAGALITILAAETARRGVAHIDACAARVLSSGGGTGRAIGVELVDGEQISAGHVVIATGAFTTPLLDASFPHHCVQPVLSGSGVATVAQRVMGTPFQSAIRTVNRAGSCGLHLIPLGGGVEYLGATNVLFREPETRPHLGVMQFLSRSALEQIDTDLAYSRLVDLRIGNRPVPLDTFPLLGPGPVEGVTILTGGYRDGLHSAPEVSALAARWILDAESAFPDEFSPLRPPISTLTVEESIESFARQQVGSAVEGGTQLTPFLAFDDLAEAFRAKARQLYAALAPTDGLHPDIVNYLTLSRKSRADVDAAAAYLHRVNA